MATALVQREIARISNRIAFMPAILASFPASAPILRWLQLPEINPDRAITDCRGIRHQRRFSSTA